MGRSARGAEYAGREVATALEDAQVAGLNTRATTCAVFCGFSVFARSFDNYLVFGPVSL